MKKPLIIISISLLLAIIGVILIIFLNKTPSDYIEIKFPTEVNKTVTEKTEFLYDEESLESHIENDTYYIYHNPKLTDYNIVTEFGFDKNEYEISDGKRFYKDGNDKCIYIDQFGCFTYDTGKGYTTFPFPFTVDECLKKAKAFLREHNLYSDRIGTKRSVNETTITKGNKETLTGIGINFFPKETSGMGVSKITVEFNGNGEIREVYYYIREYESKKETQLISIAEAIERIKKGNAFFELENPSKKLSFEKVRVSYYSQESNKNNLAMQPVYIFTGTSENIYGTTETFSITVQAN